MFDAMWIWGVLGLILLTIEIATGTFYLLWFGISALSLALATWLFPNMALPLQLVTYAALSASALTIWRVNYQKTDKHSRIGQAQGEEIGRVGTITEACNAAKTGIISFTQGLMGSREWPAIADEPIDVASQAMVIAVEGNTLRVKLVKP